MGGPWNPEIKTNTTFSEPITWSAGEGEDITPVDITGYTILFVAKTDTTKDDEDAEIYLTTGDGITITDAINGEFLIEIDAETTASYDWELASYELLMISPTGFSETLLEGQIIVTQSVIKGVTL